MSFFFSLWLLKNKITIQSAPFKLNSQFCPYFKDMCQFHMFKFLRKIFQPNLKETFVLSQTFYQGLIPWVHIFTSFTILTLMS